MAHVDRAFEIIFGEMKALGLEVNLSADKKNEALVSLRGHRSRAILREPRLQHPRGSLTIGVGDVHCGVVHHYKHMGTVRDSLGTGLTDVDLRSAATVKAYPPHAHRCFGAVRIYLKHRKRVA